MNSMTLGSSLASKLQLGAAKYQSRLWLTHIPRPNGATAFHSHTHPASGYSLLNKTSFFLASFNARGGGAFHPQGGLGGSSLVTKASFSSSSTSSSSSSSIGVKATTNKKDDAEMTLLRKEIADHFDEMSEMGEELMGDHLHHGFYDPGATASLTDMHSAQIRMTEEVIRFIDLPSDGPKNVVDVGCGLGGSSTIIAKRYEGAKCIGINLSPVQVKRAQELADAQGLGDRVSFQVADGLNQPFSDGQFDLVWVLECADHMPDKREFLKELIRVAAPGATIIITSWCHRDLSPNEKSLSPKEKKQLEKICEGFHIQSPCSTADYVNFMQSLNLQDIRTADWSQNVAPFWTAMKGSLLTWSGMTSMIFSGWKTIKGMLITPLMINGYKSGLVQFSAITCRKPYNTK